MDGEKPGVAVCCYKNRSVRLARCAHCNEEYGCPRFGSSAELLRFQDLIPPSMLNSPLPLNLWPKMWQAIEPEAAAQLPELGDSPLRRLASALGIVPQAAQSPEPGSDTHA
jgi:hypothetical protein